MAVHFSHASLPYPILNARYTMLVPYLDADGDPTDPTTPDTEISKDAGAFADCTEEVTTISGSNGIGYITFTGAEMNCVMAGVAAKVASGPKNTLATLYPRTLAIVGSGTLSAGSAGGGTLGTVLAYDVTGCFLRTTGGTGGGGTGGASNQARKIITYTISTGAFTVSPNWETTVSTDTTYDVLLPEGVTLGMLRALNPTTAGRTLDVSATGEAGVDWANVGSPTTTLALTGTTIATTQKVDVETIKTNPVVNGGTITFPTTATLASTTNITAGTITTTTNVTTVNGLASGVITATSIAADAITDAKVASDVTIASVTGAVGSVTGAVGSVTGNVGGNVGGNVTGSIGSLSTQAKADVNAEADTAIADAALATAANLATVAGYLDTEIAAILADTNELQTDWENGGRLDAILDARASQSSVDTVDDFLDSEIAAIKLKTDNLTFTVSGKVDANITHVIADPVQQNGASDTAWGGAP